MPTPAHLAAASEGRTPRRRRSLIRRLETVTPLLAVPVLLYVVVSWLAGGNHTEIGPAIEGHLNWTLLGMSMISGVRWTLSLGDCIVFLGLILLSFEMIKATSSKSSAMVNHAASMFVLIFCLIMFLLVGNYATSTFFLLTMMALMVGRSPPLMPCPSRSGYRRRRPEKPSPTTIPATRHS